MTQTEIKIAGRQLKRDEGFSGVPYQCTAGKISIGYGRNLEQNPITEAEAEFMLFNDIRRAEQQAKKLAYYQDLSANRKAVIINMVFNLGFSGVCRFRKMEAALLEHDYATAAEEMLNSKWARQVGDRADRLAEQMRSGIEQ